MALDYADTYQYDAVPAKLSWNGASIRFDDTEARHQFCLELERIEMRLAAINHDGARVAG